MLESIKSLGKKSLIPLLFFSQSFLMAQSPKVQSASPMKNVVSARLALSKNLTLPQIHTLLYQDVKGKIGASQFLIVSPRSAKAVVGPSYSPCKDLTVSALAGVEQNNQKFLPRIAAQAFYKKERNTAYVWADFPVSKQGSKPWVLGYYSRNILRKSNIGLDVGVYIQQPFVGGRIIVRYDKLSIFTAFGKTWNDAKNACIIGTQWAF